MANDKHKLPTRAEAIERARVIVAAEGGEVPGFDMATGIVDNMIARGWLEVAPEPVAPEPSDPVNYRVVDARGDTWRRYITGWCRISDHLIVPGWDEVPQPVTLFRKVDTPEPAPKYVATRDSGDWIVVNGLGAISPAVTPSQLSRWRHQSLRDAAKYQAAIDLIDSEEKEASK